jgi:hypothetical protein
MNLKKRSIDQFRPFLEMKMTIHRQSDSYLLYEKYPPQ